MQSSRDKQVIEKPNKKKVTMRWTIYFVILEIKGDSNYDASVVVIMYFCYYHLVIIILNTNKLIYLE